MPIDFYNSADLKREVLLYSLKEDALQKLSTCFTEFRSKTGLRIDPYRSTKFYGSTLLSLAELCADTDASFSRFLRECYAKDIGLIGEGD
ncbi:MAG: hypothetical protein AAF429_01145 [Pseudomonadota bacterium]